MPGAPGPRLTVRTARTSSEVSGYHQAARRASAKLSLATIAWPDNGGTIPSESRTFTPSSILFRPRRGSPEQTGLRIPAGLRRHRMTGLCSPAPSSRQGRGGRAGFPWALTRLVREGCGRLGGSWWRRRVPPPGPIGLLRSPFIAIAGFDAGTRNIGGCLPDWKTSPERSRRSRSGGDRQSPGTIGGCAAKCSLSVLFVDARGQRGLSLGVF